MHGYGEYSYWDGKVYRGQFENGKKHGIGELILVDGRKYAGRWNKGKFDGKLLLTNKYGKMNTTIYGKGESDILIETFILPSSASIGGRGNVWTPSASAGNYFTK